VSRELALRVSVDGDEVRTRAELDGAALCERTVPMPYGADTLWQSLTLPPTDAEAKLHGFGRRLARCLLDEAALRTVAALVADAGHGETLEVVVHSEGAGLRLAYELLRLPDDRVLSLVRSVRFSRRVVGSPRGPATTLSGQQRVLDVLGPAQLGGGLAAAAYDVVRVFGRPSPTPVDEAQHLAWAVGRSAKPPAVVMLARSVDPFAGDAALAETLIRQGVAHVVTMQAPPTMAFASAVAEAMLGGLANGLPPSAALAAARAAGSGEEPGLPEYALPLLFSAETSPTMDPDPTTDVHGWRTTDSMDA
jgi:hypothetical protein